MESPFYVLQIVKKIQVDTNHNTFGSLVVRYLVFLAKETRDIRRVQFAFKAAKAIGTSWP